MWEVIVGNVGRVYSGRDQDKARDKFKSYCIASASDAGRAGGESVYLMRDGSAREFARAAYRLVPALGEGFRAVPGLKGE